MTCPHAETTAILAVFDEAPVEFAGHLARCSDCQAVVAEHRETVATITPVLSAPVHTPSPRRWSVLALVLAAAAAMIVLRPTTPTTPDPIFSLTEPDAIDDSDLLSLELELALMDLED